MPSAPSPTHARKATTERCRRTLRSRRSFGAPKIARSRRLLVDSPCDGREGSAAIGGPSSSRHRGRRGPRRLPGRTSGAGEPGPGIALPTRPATARDRALPSPAPPGTGHGARSRLFTRAALSSEPGTGTGWLPPSRGGVPAYPLEVAAAPRASIDEVVRTLEGSGPAPAAPPARTPFEAVLYEIASYLVDDERRLEVHRRLERDVGLTPKAILSSKPARLLAAIEAGGMKPEMRAERVREAASIAQDLGD